MTQKLYDQDSHCRAFSAQVLTCQPGAPGTWQVTLDRTAFFPEGAASPPTGAPWGAPPSWMSRRWGRPSSTPPMPP